MNQKNFKTYPQTQHCEIPKLSFANMGLQPYYGERLKNKFKNLDDLPSAAIEAIIQLRVSSPPPFPDNRLVLVLFSRCQELKLSLTQCQPVFKRANIDSQLLLQISKVMGQAIKHFLGQKPNDCSGIIEVGLRIIGLGLQNANILPEGDTLELMLRFGMRSFVNVDWSVLDYILKRLFNQFLEIYESLFCFIVNLCGEINSNRTVKLLIQHAKQYFKQSLNSRDQRAVTRIIEIISKEQNRFFIYFSLFTKHIEAAIEIAVAQEWHDSGTILFGFGILIEDTLRRIEESFRGQSEDNISILKELTQQGNIDKFEQDPKSYFESLLYSIHLKLQSYLPQLDSRSYINLFVQNNRIYRQTVFLRKILELQAEEQTLDLLIQLIARWRKNQWEFIDILAIMSQLLRLQIRFDKPSLLKKLLSRLQMEQLVSIFVRFYRLTFKDGKGFLGSSIPATDAVSYLAVQMSVGLSDTMQFVDRMFPSPSEQLLFWASFYERNLDEKVINVKNMYLTLSSMFLEQDAAEANNSLRQLVDMLDKAIVNHEIEQVGCIFQMLHVSLVHLRIIQSNPSEDFWHHNFINRERYKKTLKPLLKVIGERAEVILKLNERNEALRGEFDFSILDEVHLQANLRLRSRMNVCLTQTINSMLLLIDNIEGIQSLIPFGADDFINCLLSFNELDPFIPYAAIRRLSCFSGTDTFAIDMATPILIKLNQPRLGNSRNYLVLLQLMEEQVEKGNNKMQNENSKRFAPNNKLEFMILHCLKALISQPQFESERQSLNVRTICLTAIRKCWQWSRQVKSLQRILGNMKTEIRRTILMLAYCCKGIVRQFNQEARLGIRSQVLRLILETGDFFLSQFELWYILTKYAIGQTSQIRLFTVTLLINPSKQGAMSPIIDDPYRIGVIMFMVLAHDPSPALEKIASLYIERYRTHRPEIYDQMSIFIPLYLSQYCFIDTTLSLEENRGVGQLKILLSQFNRIWHFKRDLTCFLLGVIIHLPEKHILVSPLEWLPNSTLKSLSVKKKTFKLHQTRYLLGPPLIEKLSQLKSLQATIMKQQVVIKSQFGNFDANQECPVYFDSSPLSALLPISPDSESCQSLMGAYYQSKKQIEKWWTDNCCDLIRQMITTRHGKEQSLKLRKTMAINWTSLLQHQIIQQR